MPPRKKRGKGKCKTTKAEKRDDTIDAVDTIKRLAKKYMVTCQSPSESGRSLREEVSTKDDEKENFIPVDACGIKLDKGNEGEKSETTCKEKTPKKITKTSRVTKKRAGLRSSSIASSSLSLTDSSSTSQFAVRTEAEMKFSRPVLGESTPVKSDNQSLSLGFSDLDSSSPLSPITYSPSERSSSPHDVPVASSSSVRRLLDWQEIPNQPTRNRERRKPKVKKETDEEYQAAFEQWVKQTNAEFAEVDKFQLIVKEI